MNKHSMLLQLFAEEGAGVAAPMGGGAEAGTAAETGELTGDVRVGDTLGDGTQVTDARVAAALNRQMNRHPELRKVYGQQRTQAQTAQPVPQGNEPAASQENQPDDLEARWEAAKKGEFKELFGRDQQKAIRERFKNQEDATAKLTAMQPMLDVLMRKTGAESLEELQTMIEDEDPDLENKAEELGMPVEAYKQFNRMQAERDAAQAQLQRQEESAQLRAHIDGLMRQGEELKNLFPDFDFFKEMENVQFRQMTSPQMGMTVEQAYYAIHGRDLMPQMMSYGMQRAQTQMGQTLQAQRARPAEGAMNGRNQAAAEPALNPAALPREERKKIIEYVKKHGPVSFERRNTT